MPAPGESQPPPAAWIELPDKSTIILAGDCHVGRVEGNEIVNPDSRISRRHAVIQRQGPRFVLVDLGSTNGTFLNDTRIFTARKLRHGDVILVGSQRYVFHQPSLAAASAPGDSAQHTIVAVGKTTCWMFLVNPPEPADPASSSWASRVRQALTDGGASLKHVGSAAFFAHWRDSRITPEKIGLMLRDVAGLPCPAGAHVAVHYGAVRVGLAAASTEENLLGAEVTMTHKLATTAATLGVGFLLSEAAVAALGPAPFVSPLSSQTMRKIPDAHPLYTIALP